MRTPKTLIPTRLAVLLFLIFSKPVRPWILRLTFSGGGSNATRVETYGQSMTSGSGNYKGIPTHTNECRDVWTPVNKKHVDSQYLSGSRDPSEVSDKLVEYSFIEGVFNPRSYTLYLYNDTTCEGLTPSPLPDGRVNLNFDKVLNKPHAVYDLSGFAGTRLKKLRIVRSFYVQTDSPRFMLGAFSAGQRLMDNAGS
ncbi:hypothetical protein ABW20_dc0105168 [Dactylellina cionopaga]|nr:hypothetical protein ABW20_dc0105168 [Dactylellina cionopaga]